jgi:hypothetical protein
MYNFMKGTTVAARINGELATRLQKATDRRRDPYAPTATQVIIRGLELALAEMERKRGK